MASELQQPGDRISKVFVAFENITQSAINDVVRGVEDYKKEINLDKNYVSKIGLVDYAIIPADQVRLKKTKEEKERNRKLYLKRYNNKPENIIKKKTYLEDPKNVEKRKQYAQLHSTKVAKERTRRIRCGILNRLKASQKQLYNEYFLEEEQRINSLMEKETKTGNREDDSSMTDVIEEEEEKTLSTTVEEN